MTSRSSGHFRVSKGMMLKVILLITSIIFGPTAIDTASRIVKNVAPSTSDSTEIL